MYTEDKIPEEKFIMDKMNYYLSAISAKLSREEFIFPAN